MNVVDGHELRATEEREADVVVVGSGPGGAAVARTCALGGARVVVIEEGPFVPPEQYPKDALDAFALLFRDLGSSITSGRSPIPVVQGRAVGGTSVVNSAISWRLPRDVHEAWCVRDPALRDALPWDELDQAFAVIERELHVTETPEEVAGQKNLLLAKGAEKLGLAHRAIHRSVKDCRGLGRCVQGCPEGRKQAMDRTYLPEACAHGAVILASTRATGVVVEGGRATAVRAVAASGASVTVRAKRAVVLAASVIQSPLLLLASGFQQGPVGKHFTGHPGVSVTARFKEPVRAWEGATQGHEMTALRPQGIKVETLGYDHAIFVARRKGVGRALARDTADLAHWADWGAAIRVSAEGTVSRGWGGRPRVRFDLNEDDVRKMWKGVRVIGELFLAAGAEVVAPGVAGWHERVSDPAVMARLEDEGPLDARAYTSAVTHLFGTCRLGSDPARSVVRPDFRHHVVDGLYVTDASVFPSNTGVNPQLSILGLATLAGRRILA